VNTTLPEPSIETVPLTALPTSVTVSASPLESRSFPTSASGARTSGVSSYVDTESSTAKGGVLPSSDTTLMLTVVVEVPPLPSLIV
jgi:hypothetical protein